MCYYLYIGIFRDIVIIPYHNLVVNIYYAMLAQNIKKYRKKRGISQDKLSKLSDVTYNTIIKIESGATYNPRVETLKKIAAALKVSIDNLMK